MIYLWRGLTLKQIFRKKWTYGQPLDSTLLWWFGFIATLISGDGSRSFRRSELILRAHSHTVKTKFFFGVCQFFSILHLRLLCVPGPLTRQGLKYYYRPQGEGNVFTGVCLSTIGLMATRSLLILVTARSVCILLECFLVTNHYIVAAK